jgi:Fe-S oxidoreductase/nitrate reductase gamma subunit
MGQMSLFWVMHLTALVIFAVGLGINISIWLRGRVGSQPGGSMWFKARATLGAMAAVVFSRRIAPLVQSFVRDGLLHSRVWREDRLRWTMHASMLWGFTILLILSTLTGLAVEILIPLFNYHNPLVDALADKDTGWLAFVNETGGVLILVGAGIAIWRRYRVKPAQLRTQNQDTLFLAFIAVIIITGYPLESLRMLFEHVTAARGWYSFIGFPLAIVLAPLNAPWESLHYWLFLFHAFVASAFIAYIPFSKTFHILISPFVAAMDHLPPDPARHLVSRPVAVRAAPPATADFGLGAFHIRQLVELDACTRCGNCIAGCPTFAETNDEMVHPLGKIAREKELIRVQFGLKGRLVGTKPDGALADFSKSVYRCTLCARCAEMCPIGLKTRDLWLSMREQLAALNVQPEAFSRLRDTVKSAHNISGDPNENRGLWAENLETRPAGLVNKRSAETVYFIGCVGAMFPAAYGIPQSFSQTLEKGGIDFTTLGGGEWCCGFPLLLAGMRDAAVELMRHNVAAVRAIGAKRLVATCPSCYHTWHTDYPEVLGEPLGFQVVHSTQLLADAIEKKRITLGPLEQKMTYHDPCDLGRTSGIFDEPRHILGKVPGAAVVEMQDHRERSLCCGGGGDVEMADPGLTAAVAKRRIGQAQATGAQTIVSACQQCKRTLTSAARKEKLRVRVQDVTEVVWNSMSAAK